MSLVVLKYMTIIIVLVGMPMKTIVVRQDSAMVRAIHTALTMMNILMTMMKTIMFDMHLPLLAQSERAAVVRASGSSPD